MDEDFNALTREQLQNDVTCRNTNTLGKMLAPVACAR